MTLPGSRHRRASIPESARGGRQVLDPTSWTKLRKATEKKSLLVVGDGSTSNNSISKEEEEEEEDVTVATMESDERTRKRSNFKDRSSTTTPTTTRRTTVESTVIHDLLRAQNSSSTSNNNNSKQEPQRPRRSMSPNSRPRRTFFLAPPKLPDRFGRWLDSSGARPAKVLDSCLESPKRSQDDPQPSEWEKIAPSSRKSRLSSPKKKSKKTKTTTTTRGRSPGPGGPLLVNDVEGEEVINKKVKKSSRSKSPKKKARPKSLGPAGPVVGYYEEAMKGGEDEPILSKSPKKVRRRSLGPYQGIIYDVEENSTKKREEKNNKSPKSPKKKKVRRSSLPPEQEVLHEEKKQAINKKVEKSAKNPFKQKERRTSLGEWEMIVGKSAAAGLEGNSSMSTCNTSSTSKSSDHSTRSKHSSKSSDHSRGKSSKSKKTKIRPPLSPGPLLPPYGRRTSTKKSKKDSSAESFQTSRPAESPTMSRRAASSSPLGKRLHLDRTQVQRLMSNCSMTALAPTPVISTSPRKAAALASSMASSDCCVLEDSDSSYFRSSYTANKTDKDASRREKKLEERLKMEEERNDDLTMHIDQLQEKMSKLRHEHEEADSKLREEQRHAERTMLEKDKEIEELSEAVNRILEAERSIDAPRGSNDFSVKLARLEMELNNANSKLVAMQKCFADMRETNVRLSAELECYRDSSKSSTSAMQAVDGTLQKQISRLQQQITAKDDTISHLMQQLTRIKQSSDAIDGSSHLRVLEQDRSGRGVIKITAVGA